MWNPDIPYEIKTSSHFEELLSGSPNSPIEIDRIIPTKDVFVLHNVLHVDECKRIIDASNNIGYGRTDYAKSYRYCIGFFNTKY